MSAVQALSTPRYLRKTVLQQTERNTNFKMLDNDIADGLTSPEADSVTPLMSKIYLRLLMTPDDLRESERVLRFAGVEEEGKWASAWEQLCRHLRVSSETANKALKWMHEQGIIGYFSGRNGVGIRIFLNRAAASVVPRSGEPSRQSSAPSPQKILAFAHTSNGRAHTSPVEAPFKDSYAVLEDLETDRDSRAPESGAEKATGGQKSFPAPTPPPTQANASGATSLHTRDGAQPFAVKSPAASPAASWRVEEVVERLRAALEPGLREAAREAAKSEHERTRQWLETRGLPKAARVAQHEAYNVLRKFGLINEGGTRVHRSQAEVGRSVAVALPAEPHAPGREELGELAEACLSMLEAQGQSIEHTLAAMSVEAGGFLSAAEVESVRREVQRLLDSSRGL